MVLRRRFVAATLAAALAAAGCSSEAPNEAADAGPESAGAAPANGTTSPTEPAADDDRDASTQLAEPPQPDASGQSGDQTDSSDAVTTTPTDAPSTAPSIEAAASSSPERLAVAGPGVAGVVQWIDSSVQVIGEAGAIDATLSDDFAEVADAGPLGLVFQRSVEEPTIWIEANGTTRALIRASDGQRLILEGVGRDESGAVVVWYQRIDATSPTNQQITLRSFEIETGAVTELATTGSRQERTEFNALTGGVVIGRWAGPATEGANLVDLDVAGTAFGGGLQPECSDGQPDCAVYGAAAYDESTGEAFGMRFVFNAEAAAIDRGGLFRFDPSTGSEEPLVAFGWSDGAWYPDDMFIAGDLVIVSLRDGAGNPLPGLVYDRSTGGYWTLPDPVFVRPALATSGDG